MSTQFKHYAKELLNIALPIIMGNLGFILIGAGDVLIAGHHSTDTLAAISIATAITNCIQTFGIGLISSVSPLLSKTACVIASSIPPKISQKIFLSDIEICDAFVGNCNVCSFGVYSCN